METTDVKQKSLQEKAKERTVKTQNIEYDLYTLVNRIKNNKIKLNPEYQRNHRWTDQMASRLIESLILNIPIPIIYISQDVDVDVDFNADDKDQVRYTVIDGQQRLTSIYRFMTDDLALTGLEMLPELIGLKHSELPQFLVRRLEDRTVKCLRIDSTVDSQVKFDIFERLNTGSIVLEPQELRNAIFGGYFNQTIKDLASNPNFRTLLWINPKRPEEDKHVKTMGDAELVLRLFALSNNRHLTYRKGFKQFLTLSMKEFSTLPKDKVDEMRDNFLKTIEVCLRHFGNSAFTKYKPVDGRLERTSKFNASVYDAVGVNVYNSIINNSKVDWKKSKDSVLNLFHSKDFYASISGTTNDTTKIRYRINAVQAIFVE